MGASVGPGGHHGAVKIAEEISVLERMAACDGQAMPDELCDALVEVGAPAVPALIALMTEDEGRWASAQAAMILGKIGDSRAIEPVLRALESCDPETMFHEKLVLALEGLGPAAVAPGLAAHDASDDPVFRADVLCALASSGGRDERLFALLMEALEVEHRAGTLGLAPANLAEYGDPRALGRLGEVFDELPADLRPPFDHCVLFELEGAIEALGGTLTPAQKARVEEARRATRAYFASRAPARRAARPGRNDPCWCASGKKYKKCHLASDEAAAAGAPS